MVSFVILQVAHKISFLTIEFVQKLIRQAMHVNQAELSLIQRTQIMRIYMGDSSEAATMNFLSRTNISSIQWDEVGPNTLTNYSRSFYFFLVFWIRTFSQEVTFDVKLLSLEQQEKYVLFIVVESMLAEKSTAMFSSREYMDMNEQQRARCGSSTIFKVVREFMASMLVFQFSSHHGPKFQFRTLSWMENLCKGILSSLRTLCGYYLVLRELQCIPGMAYGLLLGHVASYKSKFHGLQQSVGKVQKRLERKTNLSTGASEGVVYTADRTVRTITAADVGLWLLDLEQRWDRAIVEFFACAQVARESGSLAMDIHYIQQLQGFINVPMEHLRTTDTFGFVSGAGWQVRRVHAAFLMLPIPMVTAWKDFCAQARVRRRTLQLYGLLYSMIFIAFGPTPRAGIEMQDTNNVSLYSEPTSHFRWSFGVEELLVRLVIRKNHTGSRHGIERGICFVHAWLLLVSWLLFGEIEKDTDTMSKRLNDMMEGCISRSAGFPVSMALLRELTAELMNPFPDRSLAEANHLDSKNPLHIIMMAIARLWGHGIEAHWSKHYLALCDAQGRLDTDLVAAFAARLWRQKLCGIWHLELSRGVQGYESHEVLLGRCHARASIRTAENVLAPESPVEIVETYISKELCLPLGAQAFATSMAPHCRMSVIIVPCGGGKTFSACGIAASIKLSQESSKMHWFVVLMAPTAALTATLRESWAVTVPSV
jgi:hypothetical protein